MSPKGLLFRIAPTAVDSEDDPTPPNSGTESEPVALVRVIPMPINGTHNFEATSYSSGIDDEHPNEDRNHHYHHQVRRKRNVSSMPAGTGYAHYSSHSNSRLSSSCSQDEDASSQDSLTPFYQNNGKMRRSNERDDLDKTPAPHNTVADAKTPGTSASSAHRQMLDFTPDSGIAMSAHGSSSSNGLQHTSSGSGSNHHTSNNNNVNQDGNNNTNGESVKLFQQKVARIRRNYRYNFGDDSDSD